MKWDQWSLFRCTRVYSVLLCSCSHHIQFHPLHWWFHSDNTPPVTKVSSFIGVPLIKMFAKSEGLWIWLQCNASMTLDRQLFHIALGHSGGQIGFDCWNWIRIQSYLKLWTGCNSFCTNVLTARHGWIWYSDLRLSRRFRYLYNAENGFLAKTCTRFSALRSLSFT